MMLDILKKISNYCFPQSFYKKSLAKLEKGSFSTGGLHIIQKLQQNGFQAFFVGGCVRDILLGQQPKDFDIVTDARPRQLTALFPSAIIIGKRFTLVHIRWHGELLEIATFRRNPSEKEVVSNPEILKQDNTYGTLQDDLIRRDFTLNALYYDPIAKKLIDETGGLADVEARRLRTIGNDERRFTEDPVRMIRAVRYAAKLNLSLSQAIIQAIRNKLLLLGHVPKARLFEEYLKCFNPSYGARVFQKMHEHKLIRHLVPKILVEKQDHKKIIALLNAISRYDPLPEHIPALITLAFLAPYWKRNGLRSQQDLKIIFDAFQNLIAIPRSIEIAIREILLDIYPSNEEQYRYRMLPKMKVFKKICFQLLKI